MTTKVRKVVIVTGASSGIGAATAVELASAGHIVAMGARRGDRLIDLQKEIQDKGGTAHQIPLDVADADSMRTFVREIVDHFGGVDVLVNNAGIMPLSPIAALHTDEWDRMIDVNIRGVLHGIAATLPIMLQQGRGHVINIASTGAYLVMPTAAVYCATKFAVRAITDGLRQEVEGIRVTLVSPGVVQSELASTVTHAESAAAINEYRKTSLPAESIAKAIRYAIEQPPDVDVSEIVVRPTKSR
jgi:NADP-dependent 3-hydroxy acid dehydrogenase YdfG